MNNLSDETLPKSVRAAIRSFAKVERQPRHPTAEELVAYQMGELSDEASEVLREHLALCSECTGVVLDLEDFEDLEPPVEADRLSEKDQANLKRSLEDQLTKEELIRADAALAGTTLAKTTPGEKAPVVRYAVPPLYWGAMAALLLVAVGLAFREPQGIPIGTPELFHLYPEASRNTVGKIFQIPTWADSYVLVMGSVGSDSHQAVRMEIRDAAGRVVLSTDPLPRSGEGTFNHSLPRDRLPDGTYEARLFTLDTEPPELLESYTFRIIVDAPR